MFRNYSKRTTTSQKRITTYNWVLQVLFADLSDIIEREDLDVQLGGLVSCLLGDVIDDDQILQA